MRTLLLLLTGLLLASASTLLIKLFAPLYPSIALWLPRGFSLLWLAIAWANFWAGLTQAGYGLADELPLLLLIGLLPLLVGGYLMAKISV